MGAVDGMGVVMTAWGSGGDGGGGGHERQY